MKIMTCFIYFIIFLFFNLETKLKLINKLSCNIINELNYNIILYILLKKFEKENLKNEIRANLYKGMMSPSTQNLLKTLDLWVLFLICCSTFSFILNVGLRLTLEYLTISFSSESLSSILIHSPSSRSKQLLHIDTLPLERKQTTPLY